MAKAGLAGTPNEKRILSGMKWYAVDLKKSTSISLWIVGTHTIAPFSLIPPRFGLFGETPVPQKRSLLDSLAAHLETKLQYGPGERDMIMLQHRFHITKANGEKVRVLTGVGVGR